MNILSSFIHPQVVPNLFEFLSTAEHKRRDFEECLFLLTSKNTMNYQHSSKYLQQKKETHAGLEQRASESTMTELSCLTVPPFK